MKKTLAIVGLLGAVAVGGCSTQTQPDPTPVTPTAPPPISANPPPAPTEPATVAPHQAVIYTVDLQHGTDANNYLVPQTISLTDPHDPAREAVQALIAAPDSPLAAGTRLMGINIKDGMATLDFSRSPVDEQHGEETQAQALEALQRTLGQFGNITGLQITIQGRPLPAIGEAAGGPMDVIRPGAPIPESGGA